MVRIMRPGTINISKHSEAQRKIKIAAALVLPKREYGGSIKGAYRTPRGTPKALSEGTRGMRRYKHSRAAHVSGYGLPSIAIKQANKVAKSRFLRCFANATFGFNGIVFNS